MGYYLMGRIDKFLNTRTLADTAHEDCEKVLLYASEKDYAALKSSLMSNNIPVLSTGEPDIPENARIIAVLAISNNDLDNLLLCNKAKHLFPDAYLVAKCNDAVYQDIFRDTGVQHIINRDYSEDALTACFGSFCPRS